MAVQTTMEALNQFALQLPETDVGVACAGTALEARTVKRKNKAFLFLRATEARLKLSASLEEAVARASREPTRYTVGAHGWVLVQIDGKSAPLDVLKRWVEESHCLVGGANGKKAAANSKGRQKADKPS